MGFYLKQALVRSARGRLMSQRECKHQLMLASSQKRKAEIGLGKLESATNGEEHTVGH